MQPKVRCILLPVDQRDAYSAEATWIRNNHGSWDTDLGNGTPHSYCVMISWALSRFAARRSAPGRFRRTPRLDRGLVLLDRYQRGEGLVSKKTLVEAALGRPQSRIPIWFLRQAGRYLPEYMEIRRKLEFVELCENPELAAEVTLQPLRRYDVDAAIIFSDILIPCHAMGQKLTFDKGHGPQLSNPVRNAVDLARLKKPDAEKELGFVGQAIVNTKKGLRPDQTMIGFAGAPFTVASYMIEGSGSKTFTEVKRLRYTEPETFRGLLKLLTETTIEYLLMQVRAGADCLMLFDTWANQLTAIDYRDFIFPAVNTVMEQVKARWDGPLIYYPGQSLELLFELNGFRGDVLAIDWRTRLPRAVALIENLGLDVSIQGNLDPQMFLAPEALLRQSVRDILEAGGKARGHIFNVGHGLLPITPPDAVKLAIDEVRKYEQSRLTES
jgi:uroporphyrinogen decarboxylase